MEIILYISAKMKMVLWAASRNFLIVIILSGSACTTDPAESANFLTKSFNDLCMERFPDGSALIAGIERMGMAERTLNDYVSDFAYDPLTVERSPKQISWFKDHRIRLWSIDHGSRRYWVSWTPGESCGIGLRLHHAEMAPKANVLVAQLASLTNRVAALDDKWTALHVPKDAPPNLLTEASQAIDETPREIELLGGRRSDLDDIYAKSGEFGVVTIGLSRTLRAHAHVPTVPPINQLKAPDGPR